MAASKSRRAREAAPRDQISPTAPGAQGRAVRPMAECQGIILDRAGEVVALGPGQSPELQEIDGEIARFQIAIARVDHLGIALQLDQGDDAPVMSVGVIGIDFQGGVTDCKGLRKLLVEDQDAALHGQVFRQLAAAGRALTDDLIEIMERGLAKSGAEVRLFQDPEGAGPVQGSRVRFQSDRPAKLLEGRFELVLVAIDLGQGDIGCMLPRVERDRLFQIADGVGEISLLKAQQAAIRQQGVAKFSLGVEIECLAVVGLRVREMAGG